MQLGFKRFTAVGAHMPQHFLTGTGTTTKTGEWNTAGGGACSTLLVMRWIKTALSHWDHRRAGLRSHIYIHTPPRCHYVHCLAMWWSSQGDIFRISERGLNMKATDYFTGPYLWSNQIEGWYIASGSQLEIPDFIPHAHINASYSVLFVSALIQTAQEEDIRLIVMVMSNIWCVSGFVCDIWRW